MVNILFVLAIGAVILLAVMLSRGQWGEQVHTMTNALGIPECDACARRRATLNRISS